MPVDNVRTGGRKPSPLRRASRDDLVQGKVIPDEVDTDTGGTESEKFFSQNTKRCISTAMTLNTGLSGLWNSLSAIAPFLSNYLL